ncbi:galactosylgalactosylxylosylprotein 3-beta-glucuronosyltransferase 2-like [Penaeus chinensis]|uniref:galactosylgalactosylxylosylprotein 3-beta-glucuronosyltransferase 2-like n=1 Tax=Penaeus chinensis TaxID=139456 RepID=UPI001FB74D6B|nr:galactosylgalactosylxylosylprotein 3-beta-glucuronosyltransferase 2-like [Penaeus chinensis]
MASWESILYTTLRHNVFTDNGLLGATRTLARRATKTASDVNNNKPTMTLLNPYKVRRKINKYYSYIVFLVVLWILWYGDLFSFHWQKPLDPLDGVPRTVVRELIELRRQVRQLKTVLKEHRIPEKEYSDPFLTTIYVITPTYARPHQKAELTR